MDCLLCLEWKTNDTDGIQMDSITWIGQNVNSVIEKHLWPMIMYKTESQWLCMNCWQILHEFHKFYNRIESAHMNLSGLMKIESDNHHIKPKDFISLDLLEPEMVIDEPPVAFVKQEFREHESDKNFDPDFQDEDDIPLIQMRPCVENSLSDPINENEPFTEDPLIKKEKNTKSKKRKSKTESSGKSSKISASNNDTECKIKTDPDETETANGDTSPPSCQVIMPDKNDNSPVQYHYESKLSSADYDAFINKHFKLVCNKCKITVETFDELHSHFKEIHHKKHGYAVCCGIKIRCRSFLVDHINVHINPEYFKCEHCPEILTLRKTYNIHMKTHDLVYECDMCDRKCISKYLLRQHQLTHLSEEEKKFPCDVCEKSFATETNLNIHQKAIHLRIYSKLCDICGQYIPSSDTFKRHMLNHEGVKDPTLSCDICGRLMKNELTLKKHKKLIHPADGIQEYTCHICLRVSPNKKALTEHIRRVHRAGYNHKCTICEKAFKRIEHLKDHTATHTGVGRAKCPYCSKEFNANSSMHLHRKKIHPKEWEEDRLKKYSGKVPPNTQPKPQTTEDMLKYSLQFDL